MEQRPFKKYNYDLREGSTELGEKSAFGAPKSI